MSTQNILICEIRKYTVIFISLLYGASARLTVQMKCQALFPLKIFFLKMWCRLLQFDWRFNGSYLFKHFRNI